MPCTPQQGPGEEESSMGFVPIEGGDDLGPDTEVLTPSMSPCLSCPLSLGDTESHQLCGPHTLSAAMPTSPVSPWLQKTKVQR